MQSDQSLCLSLEYSMTVKLLTAHDLKFQNLKGDCTGSPQSTLVKMPHCWKPHMSQLNLLKKTKQICFNMLFPRLSDLVPNIVFEELKNKVATMTHNKLFKYYELLSKSINEY